MRLISRAIILPGVPAAIGDRRRGGRVCTRYRGFYPVHQEVDPIAGIPGAGCDRLYTVTFGQGPSTRVRLTIVPVYQGPEPVEIMSVDVLSEAEKAMLAHDFDRHGQVI